MMNVQMDNYLYYFHLKEFNLVNFRDEIKALFRNDDPLYYFDIDNCYYIHLLDTNGDVIYRVSFKLFSLTDEEDLIEDSFNILSHKYIQYLTRFEGFNYPIYLGIYISKYTEESVDYKNYFLIREKCIFNICKMKNDLMLPISLVSPYFIK